VEEQQLEHDLLVSTSRTSDLRSAARRISSSLSNASSLNSATIHLTIHLFTQVHSKSLHHSHTSVSGVEASIPTQTMATSRILTLAKDIEACTTKIDNYLIENNLPPPSFDEDAPLMYQFPPDIAKTQEALSTALDELWWLNQGPIQTVVAKSVSFFMNNEHVVHLEQPLTLQI
jgi:hypothetical protein